MWECLALLFLLLSWVPESTANFNLFVDKEEFHRITGGTLSQVFLVQEGKVNDYALRYVMTVPYHVHYLDFKWQATSKKTVHYELLIEFSDFFALLQPSANVSTVGRLPTQLETVRISLPCSGRLSTEVPVIIRFTFHTKHKNNKHNVINVNLKRNKICLLKKEFEKPPEDRTSPGQNQSLPNTLNKNEEALGPYLAQPAPSQPPPPEPSHLLAFLLGACAVSASLASVLFFICLRRRLEKMDLSQEEGSKSNSLGTNSSRPPSFKEEGYKSWGQIPHEVSPYACAQILPQANHLQRQQVLFDKEGMHTYENVMFSHSPNLNFSSFPHNRTLSEGYYEGMVGGGGRMRLGSIGSVVQINGFQVGRNLTKDKNVVERFL